MERTKISLIITSRNKGNINSALLQLLNSLKEKSADCGNFEVLVGFDDDDNIPNLDGYPFVIKKLIEPRNRGYIDAHLRYNRLLTLLDAQTTIIGAMADDFEIITPNWDSIILGLSYPSSDIFIIHGKKANLDFDLNSLENQDPDECPFWSRKLLEVCGVFNISFTDAWTLALENILWQQYHKTCSIPIPPVITRKLCENDYQGNIRWQTDRAQNLSLMRSEAYLRLLKAQANNLAQAIHNGNL